MKFTRFFNSIIAITLIAFFVSSCSSTETTQKEETSKITPTGLDPFAQNELLGRGINLGNSLEAPTEGEWGMVLEEKFFKLISEAGFNSVRIPIKWSAHASTSPPYKIDEDFFLRIDWIVEMAKKYRLAAIFNMHHFDEIFEEPKTNKERFLALWEQISERYKYLPKEFLFEPLNEPHANLTSDIWNNYLADAIKIIRITNPGRTIIINSAEWGGAGSVPKLVIPKKEENVIVSFHFYEPFHFTHQGTEWNKSSDDWLGLTWSGTDDEIAFINERMDIVTNWAKEHNRPINIGEFGCYSRADMKSRIVWTTHIAQVQAPSRDFSWNYWEFGAGFGIYDRDSSVWREKLLKALIP